MADFTLADYRSLVLGYYNEDRDNPESNRKIRVGDVDKAINLGRRSLLRKVGIGLYRSTSTQDAKAGALTLPADFFNQAIVSFRANSTAQWNVLTAHDARWMDQRYANWREQTAAVPSKIVWSLETTGKVARLYPQPTSTVTGGLLWNYNAQLEDLAADDDVCPLMQMFPEFEMLAIPAAALRVLYLLEGGAADEQHVKWNGIFEHVVKEMNAAAGGLFVEPEQIIGNQSF